ncbi:MAG: toxin HipA [Deltaproteobacteria bacterium RIFCSPLOWO2_02_FULL_46_8]|nr:MAG: toxin HipA [Deltaproteobacteria bacterium RIFCSPLOWO2_02_FULL_46_8]
MRQAKIFVHGKEAGYLKELDNKKYSFTYLDDYTGHPVSLSMPIEKKVYAFDSFPPFFDGLLPEGFQLEALLKKHKIDRRDYFTQLVTVGGDLVGAVTAEEVK